MTLKKYSSLSCKSNSPLKWLYIKRLSINLLQIIITLIYSHFYFIIGVISCPNMLLSKYSHFVNGNYLNHKCICFVSKPLQKDTKFIQIYSKIYAQKSKKHHFLEFAKYQATNIHLIIHQSLYSFKYLLNVFVGYLAFKRLSNFQHVININQQMMKYLFLLLLITVLTNCSRNQVDTSPDQEDEHTVNPSILQNVHHNETKTNDAEKGNKGKRSHRGNRNQKKENDFLSKENKTQTRNETQTKQNKTKSNRGVKHRRQNISHKNQTSEDHTHLNHTDSNRTNQKHKESRGNRRHRSSHSNIQSPYPFSQQEQADSTQHPSQEADSTQLRSQEVAHPAFQKSCQTDEDCKKSYPYIMFINFKIKCNLNTKKCQFA